MWSWRICVKLTYVTDGFALNWQIFGAEKKSPLCETVRYSTHSLSWAIFRDDKIFWISVDKSRYHSDFYPTTIYEILEINGTFHIDSVSNFGSFRQIFQFFPPVLTPMRNEKYIFYPQFVESITSEPISFIEVEEWEITQGLNTSVWSFINFPFNFPSEAEQLWIFKL